MFGIGIGVVGGALRFPTTRGQFCTLPRLVWCMYEPGVLLSVIIALTQMPKFNTFGNASVYDSILSFDKNDLAGNGRKTIELGDALCTRQFE